MNTKLLIAYEPEDSNTIRMTPETIGILVSKLSPDQMKKMIVSLKEQTIYRDKDWRQSVKCELGAYILRIEEY